MSKTDFVTPQDAALVLIDYQPAMFQGVESHDRLSVMHNVQALAKAARLFKLPTLLSTVAKDSFAGPFMPEVTDLFPGAEVIDRSSINAWLDANFRKAVEAMGRKRIILAGLWTEACVTFPTLDLLKRAATHRSVRSPQPSAGCRERAGPRGRAGGCSRRCLEDISGTPDGEDLRRFVACAHLAPQASDVNVDDVCGVPSRRSGIFCKTSWYLAAPGA